MNGHRAKRALEEWLIVSETKQLLYCNQEMKYTNHGFVTKF